MFGNGSIDFKGPAQVYDGVVHIKKSSKNKMVRYIEIMDGSSPITVKEVKPPHASNSKAEPLEIQSNTENTSGSKVTEESRNGGDTPKKKRKVSSVTRVA